MRESIRSTFTERGIRTSVVLLGVLLVVGVLATGSVAGLQTVDECQILDTPNETYQLNDTIQNETAETCLDIKVDGVTLDGNGYTVDGVNQTTDSVGIFVNESDDVTVENFGNVTGWETGIGGAFSVNVTLTDNTANNNELGFRLIVAESTLTGNTANDNVDDGFALDNSFGNILTGNTVNNNEDGIALDGLEDNELTGNTANENEQTGIELDDNSDDNTLTDNTANNNDVGILLEGGSENNLLELNEANENTWGIIVLLSDENELVENEANHNDGEFGAEQPLPPIIEDFPGIGIKIAGSADTTVQDNEANQNGFTGISVLDSSGTEVDNNDVHENGVDEGGFAGQFGSGIGVFRGFSGDTPSEPEPRELAVLSSHTSPNRITDNDATGNQVGITLLGATNNTLSDNTATENFVGIQTFDAFNNTFTDDTSRDNIEFDYMDMTGYSGVFANSFEQNSLEPNAIESPGISDLNTVENLNIGNSEKPNTEVSFKTVNFVLRGTSAQPPANPEAESTGRYFETAPTFFFGGGPGGPIGDIGELSAESIETQQHELPSTLLDIDLHYNNADVQGIDESSLSLWAFDTFEPGWLDVSGIDEPGSQGPEVNEQKNVVSWNYTLGTLPASQNEITPQDEGEVSPIQLPVFGAFGESTGCVNRRNLGRGQENSECPFDRDVQRGGSREELDRSTGRGGDGRHRDSATSRRNRGR